jgi:hypothetical protein
MTKSIPDQSQTIYSKIWQFLTHFPEKLSQGSNHPPEVSGPAAAALVSAAFSCFLLMVNQHFTSLFKAWDQIIWDLGSWIPGSKNPDPLYGEIGSYSGKETVMLIGWLISWLILHQFWKNKQIKTRTIFSYLFIFMVAATVMNWHPLFPYLPLMPK